MVFVVAAAVSTLELSPQVYDLHILRPHRELEAGWIRAGLHGTRRRVLRRLDLLYRSILSARCASSAARAHRWADKHKFINRGTEFHTSFKLCNKSHIRYYMFSQGQQVVVKVEMQVKHCCKLEIRYPGYLKLIEYYLKHVFANLFSVRKLWFQFWSLI